MNAVTTAAFLAAALVLAAAPSVTGGACAAPEALRPLAEQAAQLADTIEEVAAGLDRRAAEVEERIAAGTATAEDYALLDATLDQLDAAEAQREEARALAERLCSPQTPADRDG